MIPPVNTFERFTDENGILTHEGQHFLQEMKKLVEEHNTLKDAIGAITKPTGGGTVDAEARTAIDAIIDAGAA